MALNRRLKVAIIESGQSQRAIAATAGNIREVRFSDIVRGQVQPSPSERAAIAAVLGKPETALFDVIDVAG